MAELVLGRLKFKWQGDWAGSVSYIKDDIVRYGGNVYVAVENFTSDTDFYVDLTANRWELMTAGQEWKGSWTTSTTYKINDIVSYGPSTFICTEGHSSSALFETDLDANKWTTFSQGLSNAGVWTDGVRYQVNEIVTYGGAVYICVEEHSSDESTDTRPTNADYWQKFVDGQQFEGSYSSAIDYQKGDIVEYGGYLYVAITDTRNNLPTDTVYWDVYVKGYRDRGLFVFGTLYLPGDTVALGGNKYVVKEGRPTATTYPTDTSDWTLTLNGLAYRQQWNAQNTYHTNEIVRYGGNMYICTTSIFYTDAELPNPEIDARWNIYSEGFKWQGEYNANADYKIGDVVRLSARAYLCIEGYENDGSTTPEPPNPVYWELLVDGLAWRGVYNASTEYEIGDVVEYSQSSYVCVSSDVVGVTPGTDPASWNLVAQGDISSPMTQTGDMIYRNASGNVERLPVGPSGAFLTVNNGIPSWGHLTPQNDYYVSPQGDDSNDGRTATSSWRTIRHAAEQTFNLGLARINVQAGVYEEQTPIRVGRGIVLEGNGLGAVTVSPNNDRDEGFGVGISDDGSTPNANSDVFYMNNGARMRNFVFRGFSTGSVIVSLDPGYGPDDTSVWITSQSPYVQNCTSFTPGGTGFKIDGALHNGGYKSMVANDWTQINSDGIGIHALNDGRTEIVSCFTYYCNIGYLAESGAKIRAIVGNNSYGEFGAVARGFSQLETPLTGNLRLDDKTIDSVIQIASNVHVFTSYRDEVGNRFFVGHTDPTGTDVTSTFDATASYPFIAKYNSAGSLDWIYTYESSFGAIHSAVELSDRIYCGGVIVDGTNKGFILSISKAGEIQWQKTIGNTTEITDLATDGNNLYAVGNHTTTGVCVIKTNPAGVEQWTSLLEYNDSSAANTLTASSCTFAGTPTTSVDTYALAGDATAEDNLYVAAYDSTVNQSVIIRLDSGGNFVTSYQYGDVRINSLRLDTGNGDGIYLMAAGYYDPAGGVNANPLLFRLSVDGTVQWQNQLELNTENGEYTDVLPFGNDVYAVGYFNEGTNNNNAGLIARYTSTGVTTFVNKLDNGTNNIALNGVMLDGVNVISAGIENGNSLITNIQRDNNNGLGTVTSGSYTYAQLSVTTTSNTVVERQINAIAAISVVSGLTDESLTLNQSPTQSPTIVSTRAGFAGIGTGVLFTIDSIERSPKEGSVLQIDGDDETYFVIGVNNYDEVGQTGQVQVDPPIPSNKTPNDDTSVVFREAFSQVRMSGHDFLDIGTGGFADTNYPVIIASDYTQAPNQNRETLSEDGGRVFYVTTDQDGNFRVGDYFKVEQATGRATLSSEEFDLAGLNELQLGSITAGRQGATVNEFSTDGTFADNSDTAVPTEKATKTYVDNAITNAIGDNSSIQTGNAPSETKVSVSGTGVDSDTIDFDISGTTVSQIGSQYLLIPKGTTAERPGSPVSGQMRFNTDINALEVYNSAAWVPAGGFSNVEIANVDSPYTASTFQYIYVDSTGGVITVNLPSSANLGDQIKFIDVAGNFATSNLTIGRNGLKIFGGTEDLTVNNDNAAFGLIYTGATYGWQLMEV